MKGYTSHKGYDCSPCFFCKKRGEESCSYFCISNVDVALHKANAETEFASFEPLTPAHLAVLEYEQQRGKEK